MNSYEDLAFLESLPDAPACLYEAWRGTDLVKWQSRLLVQMEDLLAKYQKMRNHDYANKLAEILKVWKANELTGSINVEDVKILQAACGQLAVDDWKLQKYFRNIETNLRAIIASEEELPRTPEENPGPASPTPRSGAMKEEPAPEAAHEATPTK